MHPKNSGAITADFSTAVHTGQRDHEAPNREGMDFTH